MIRRHFLAGAAILSLTMIFLTGCSRSPRVAYYTLSQAATPDSETTAPGSVSIGPVTLPELLERPQLVVRTSANRVEILEYHRWAESLKSVISRIIVENLAVMLKPFRVSSYAQNAGLDADFRLSVDIQRFEMIEGEGVTLEALWTIKRVAGGEPKSGRAVISERAGGAGYEALVEAQSRALAAFSRDLARELRAGAALTNK